MDIDMGIIIGLGNSKPTFPYDYYYGIEWDITVSNAKPTRIGKKELHKELPLQNLMRRCILQEDGSVNYYLHPNDSTKRDNGAAADLSGKDGMYMVELPDVYIKFEIDGNKRRALISPHALPGFTLWKKDYVSAVEASVQRSTGLLVSVCNKDVDYRGGSNNASYDAGSNTLLGRPATSISTSGFQTAARKNGRSTGWNAYLYQTHRKLWWLFAIEYANFNSQDAFTAELDINGYHQGGLSEGVTTIEWGKWSTFNGNNPFIPCGHTNSLGNKSGFVEYTMPTEYDATSKVVKVPSYRGVENPFGHVWKWTVGSKVMIQSETDGGLSQFYVCDNPENIQFNGINNYELRGVLPRNEGYVKQIVLGEHGDIMPLEIGAGTTTYFCDYFYTNVPASGTSERVVAFGGAANNGANAGFVFAYTTNTASGAGAYYGSRLCFLP